MPLVSLDDFDLHYDSSGTGEPVMLIHGLGSSGADWAFQVPALECGFQVICPDLRGAGLSGKPSGPYAIEQFADDLWQLLDRLNISSCHLVGFSLGGAVALEMALQRPVAAQRLVMINALPTYRIDHWRKWVEAHVQLTLVRWLGLPRAARIIARRIFPNEFQAPMRRRVEQVVGQNARRPYLDSLKALMRWCGADRLNRLRSETMMLSAEFDYTPSAEKRAWAEQMNADFVEVKNSRHGTPFDAISATNLVLKSFLTGGNDIPANLVADNEAQFAENTSGS